MSRTRTREIPARQIWYRASGNVSGARYDVSGYPNYSVLSPYCSDLMGTSVMTDVDPLLTKNTCNFNAIDHVKTDAAFVDGSVLIAYETPTPALFVKPLSVSVRLKDVSPAGLPAIQWDNLIRELAAKIDGSISQGFLLPVTLIELGKTIAMLKNPFNLLKADWRKICGKKTASSLLKAGSNFWLEHRYGWLSAKQDIRSLAKTIPKLADLSHKDEQEDVRFSVSETESKDWACPIFEGSMTESGWQSKIQSLSWASDQGGYSRITQMRTTRIASVGCHQNQVIANRLSTLRRVLNAVGADYTQILDVLWEVIPYSFVIDWFVDWHALVTPLIAKRLSRPDVSNLGCSVKTRTGYTLEWLCSLKSLNYYGGGPWGYLQPTGIISGSPVFKGLGMHSKYVRSTGLPSTQNIIDGFFDLGLSAIRTTSGAALLIQRLLK